MAGDTEHVVTCWTYGGLAFEWHEYPPGPAGEVPPHVHDEYQICLSLDFPGRYAYRGERLRVPVSSVAVIHPGEVHSAQDPFDRMIPSTFRMVYVDPVRLRDAAADLIVGLSELPFIREAIIDDALLGRHLLALHMGTEKGAPALYCDATWGAFAERLLTRYAGVRPRDRRERSGTGAVLRAKDYLSDHFTDDVTLARLAEAVGVSPFHLTRIFAAEMGTTPHAFLVGVRVTRAKALLRSGTPPAQVAFETGFADQSHLNRHFKRLVGTTPARYAP